MTENIKVFLQDLPERVKGFTVRVFDEGQEFYCIVLNARLNRELLTATYDHEMEHINNRDFDMDISADQLEAMRHAV